MRLLKKIFDYYLEASIHVALAIVSLTMVNGLWLNIHIPYELIFFIFFGSVAAYNFVKNGPELIRFKFSAADNPSYAGMLVIVAGLFALWFGLMLPQKNLAILAFLLIVILLYTYPIAHSDKNLRSLGVLKVVLVAISWTTVTVYLLAVFEGSDWDWDLNIVALQTFLLVVSLIIPFEIRDMQFDPPDIRTIPRRIGVKWTKRLGILLIFLSTFLLFLRDDISKMEILLRGVLLIAVSLFIWMTPINYSKYYASFWIEAIPIFWLGLILGLCVIF
ncbi:MAG: hypothetical protein ABF293_13860 [Flavobacteriaceae bacterium]